MQKTLDNILKAINERASKIQGYLRTEDIEPNAKAVLMLAQAYKIINDSCNKNQAEEKGK